MPSSPYEFSQATGVRGAVHGSKGKTPRRDLFGRRVDATATSMAVADTVAAELRRLSEQAYRAGLLRSSSLIEITAQIVELEGLQAQRDGAER